MGFAKRLGNWLSNKFDAWFQKVGEENRPAENEDGPLQDDCPLISQSDLICDEKGG